MDTLLEEAQSDESKEFATETLFIVIFGIKRTLEYKLVQVVNGAVRLTKRNGLLKMVVPSELQATD